MSRIRCICAAFLLMALSVTAGAQGQLPPAGSNVPKVGDKAPGFTLPDTSGKSVKLSELLAAPATANAGNEKGAWVLLIFYRGHW